MSLWNHEQIDCLFKSLFGKILIKTIRSASLALCGVTGGSPSQRISNKVSVFVPLCHYNHEWHRYNHLGVFLLIKGLITVGRELRQQHPSDLLSGAGTPRERSSRGCCCRNSRPTVINPDYNMTNQRNITHIYDKNTFKFTTKSSDVVYLPPLWRHASLLNDENCSFTHPVVKGRSARGTSSGT